MNFFMKTFREKKKVPPNPSKKKDGMVEPTIKRLGRLNLLFRTGDWELIKEAKADMIERQLKTQEMKGEYRSC